MSRADRYLDWTLSRLVRTIPVRLSTEEKERHRIPALALMTLVARYWCGNKYGLDHTYPLNPVPPQQSYPASYRMKSNISALMN